MEHNIATEVKSAMISVVAKKGPNNITVYPKVIVPNSSLNNLKIVRSSFTEVSQDRHKATVKNGYELDKLESGEAASENDSKKEMFKRKSTRVKSRKTKNLIKDKMKESFSNTDGVKRTRNLGKAPDFSNETKEAVISLGIASAYYK